MAGRPCQPTNPPPKQYKPPIMRKSQSNGNSNQYNTHQKIDNPNCGAGTHGYAASYRQILTNTRHPTMTPPTGTSHPMLPKNIMKHNTKKGSNIITTNIIIPKPTPTNTQPLPLPAGKNNQNLTNQPHKTNYNPLAQSMDVIPSKETLAQTLQEWQTCAKPTSWSVPHPCMIN